MVKVADVLRQLESIAPRRYAFGFDKVGLQVGDAVSPVSKAVVSLDRSLGAIRFAAEHGAQLLIAHHPAIWDPLKSVFAGDPVFELIRCQISFIAAHTNWDVARGGVNDTLAEVLGLTDVVPFGQRPEAHLLKLVFTVPSADSEKVIAAAAAAGAGRLGSYDSCAFSSQGTGQFRALDDANPHVGKVGEVHQEPETRVEMILPTGLQLSVDAAVRSAHPYETPAIDYFPLSNPGDLPIGRIGSLAHEITLADFSATVSNRLGHPPLVWGDPRRMIKRVAVVGGAADGEWQDAARAGADCFITGEVRQNVAVDSTIPIIAAGHYATEQPGVRALRDRLQAAIPGVEWLLFTPEPGHDGRPFVP